MDIHIQLLPTHTYYLQCGAYVGEAEEMMCAVCVSVT